MFVSDSEWDKVFAVVNFETIADVIRENHRSSAKKREEVFERLWMRYYTK